MRAIRRNIALAAAIAPLFAAVSAAHATGDFDGEQLPAGITRLWDVGGANPGLNWVADTLPVAADSITLNTDGDGILDLNALARAHAGLSFKDWTSYLLTDGTFSLGTPGSTILVGGSVSSTYGSDYFADGNALSTGLTVGFAAATQTIMFGHLDTGVLRLSGPLGGTEPLAISRIAAGLNIRPVYFDLPNGGYTGPVTVNMGTAARILGVGRTGTGLVTLNGGGEFGIYSDVGGQAVTNTFAVTSGVIRADHNYTGGPLPAYAPGVLHTLGPGAGVSLTLDNGGLPADVTFSANNGYNFVVNSLAFANAGGGVPGTRTVEVDNGFRTDGWAGSTRMTGNNRLQEQVVTTFAGPAFAVGVRFTDGGMPLIKTGTGVLAISGVNAGASIAPKTISGGVLRFNAAASFGVGAVTLAGGPGPVSSGVGVGYSVLPAGFPGGSPLVVTSAIPGQSGAFDVDFGAYAAAFAPAFGGTALRLGSSGAGITTGAVAPYGPTATYYLGGGGGTLELAAVGPPLAVVGDTVQMGTTGLLLPGRVNLARPVITFAAVNIRAGTLQVMPAGLIGSGGAMPGSVGGTSLGCYSTSLGLDASYGGAPVATPYNGPGQLLLDSAVQAGPGYIYGPGGHFGFGGLTLDGGAIGYTTAGVPPVFTPVGALPGAYGTTLSSLLYTSAGFPGPAQLTANVLHFGGEYSTGGIGTGAITPFFPIPDNGANPVVLLKSGVDSVLDLTAPPVIGTYTGGTGILGGEILINSPVQLGSGAIVIADGGTLHLGTGGIGGLGPPVVPFPQILRVANGVGARSSRLNVDAGLTADFSFAFFEAATPGSVLEKTGAGILNLTPPFVYPTNVTMANTWGIKAAAGTININQLPGIVTPANGSAVFDGGTLHITAPGEPFPVVLIPAATQYSPSYGFSGIQTYAGTASTLEIGNPTIAGASAFFRITGAQTSSLMGSLAVSMGSGSVMKIAGNALGDDTRGTGSISFSGFGSAVQFTPGGGNILFPRDAAFTMTLSNGVQFSGCPDANFNGNLIFTTTAGFPVFIDGATVDDTVVPKPVVTPAIWTIGGTGSTTWDNWVEKTQTESVPGSGGPYSPGTVTINRDRGAPVSITPLGLLDIEFGTLNAGGTGDPFTDTTFPLLHLPVLNNAAFNITAGTKDVASIAGVGTTTVFAGATLLVGSDGPVTQTTFTVNGTADVGDVNVSGTTGVGPSPALLSAHYVRGGSLSIMSGTAFIKDNGTASGVSRVGTLTIGAGGHLNIRDNHVIVTTTPTGTWNGAVYTDLQGLVASGRNGNPLPLWDGATGIITTETFATTGNLTSIGIAKASDVRPATATATGMWAGQTITGTDTLIMYTYGGDATLDGKINIDDYIKIDAGFAGALTGWSNGDFNYDGKVNIDDYTTVIDANFPNQIFGIFFTAGGIGAGGSGVSAVPEPIGGVAAGIMLGVSLLGSRRRDRRRV